MQPFTYSAYGPDGGKTAGEISAKDRDEAFAVLRARNLTPISISDGEDGPAAATPRAGLLDRLFHDPLLIVRTIRMLAILIARNVPVPDALELAADVEPSRRGKRLLKTVAAGVAEGQGLSEAMSGLPRFASPYVLSMISAGENTATLGEVLETLADQLEREQELKRKISSALAYPILLILAVIGMVIFLALYMVPSLMPLLEQSGGEIPAVISIMNDGAVYFSANSQTVLTGLAAILGLLVILSRSRAVKLALEELVFALPLIGPMVSGAETIRFCSSLGTMVRHHVRLVPALEIAQNVVRTAYFKNAVQGAVPDLKEGKPLHEAFAVYSRFPKTFTALTRAGGETRALPEALAQIADVQRAILEKQIETAIKLLPPVLTLLVGTFIGMFVLVIVDALMSLNDAIL